MSKNRRLQILMPMAGRGSRFLSANYKIPKPMIPINNNPMFVLALSCLTAYFTNNYLLYFVVLKEHVDTFGINKVIMNYYPKAHITIAKGVTRGALETAWLASEYLSRKDGVIIMDCDFWFKSKPFMDEVGASIMGIKEIDGALLTFTANHPRYSYVVIDNKRFITDIAEKKVISNNAVAGAYYFTKADEFTKIANKLTRQEFIADQNELYMSIAVKELLLNNGRIRALPTESYTSFGTPEELKDSMQSNIWM